MPQTAEYRRISKDAAGERAGVERQATENKAKYGQKLGRGKFVVYEDNDISATQKRKPRPAFERMLEAIANGEHDTIVVWALDRLVRRLTELERLIELSERHPFTVLITTGMSIDLATVSGRMAARLIVAVGQSEVEIKSERQKAAARDRAARGVMQLSGIRRFGFEDDGLTVRKREADAIRRVAAAILDPENPQSVTSQLKILREASPDMVWTTSRLRDVLLSGRMVGRRDYIPSEEKKAARSRPYARDVLGKPKAPWPAILDDETHLALMKYYADSAKRHPQGGRRQTALLTGLVKCGVCGRRMVMTGAKDRYYYQCAVLQGHEKYNGIGGRGLEDYIMRWIAAWPSQSMAVLEKIGNKREATEEQRRIDRELAKIEAAMTHITEMREDGLLTREEANKRFREREQQREDLLIEQRAMLGFEPNRNATPEMVADMWASTSNEDRRQVVALLIDSIVIHPITKRLGNKIDTKRIDFRWSDNAATYMRAHPSPES